ncbi:FMN-binding protein, partial [Psychrobacter sp. 1Y4]|uniref:FMN-binding protein n=1 Tax=Psychrobacter sp. 1Y4 TaxID=3453575 RepID=UPI003F471F0B
SFYEHKETPGLGARIEEPEWRAKWNGIHSYDDSGEVATGVTKAGNSKENWVDGISGATLTSRGVSNMIQFWLGEQGYKPYLDMLREQSGQTLDNADTQANQSKPAAQPKTELAATLPVANGKEA